MAAQRVRFEVGENNMAKLSAPEGEFMAVQLPRRDQVDTNIALVKLKCPVSRAADAMFADLWLSTGWWEVGKNGGGGGGREGGRGQGRSFC